VELSGVTPAVYLVFMGTQYPRVALVKDPELQAVLQSTRHLLDLAEIPSEAGRVKRLALIGARALLGDDEEPALEAHLRVLGRPGVRPASHHLADLPWLDTETPDPENTASQGLEWVRGD
jgi:hypothetical protein